MCRKLIYVIFTFVLGLSTVIVAEAPNPNAGWWKFYEGSDGIVHDSSGNDRHGTIEGSPTWTSPGWEGWSWCMEFGGDNDRITVESFELTGTGITLAAWIKPTSYKGDARIISKTEGGGTSEHYWAMLLGTSGDTSEDRIQFRLRTDVGSGATAVFAPAGAEIPLNEWTHVAVTWDASDPFMRLFTNADEVHSASKAGTAVALGPDKKIGIGNQSVSAGAGSTIRPFGGFVDDVRVYDYALSADEMKELLVAVFPAKASGPTPADGAQNIDREVTLSWTPGVFADKHDVYFGDNYNDVSDANRTNHPAGVVVSENQDANSYSVPELLDYGMTYYWKISEVNDPPTTIFEGKVWEFTTELFAYPITPITATASSEITGKEAINTINESGLTDDLHSTDMSAMWLSGDEPTGAVIQYEFDKVYKLYEMWVWNCNGPDLNTIPGFKDVTIEYSVDGSSWTPLAGVPQFAIATGESNYAHNTTVPFGVTAKYVKLTATSNWSNGATTQYGLSEVRFYRIPVRASRPEPTSGSTVTNLDGVQLKWRAGREAASHDVYLSDSTPPAYAGNVTVTNYPTGTLELGKTYYWQINEVNLAEVPDTWEGPVWNFSTPTSLNVEDMESYTDRSSIRTIWKDGYAYSVWSGGDPNLPVWAPNGSNVNTSTDHPSGPGPKMGTQAMAYNYDNDGNTAVPGYEAWSYDANYFSEATAQTSGPNSLDVGTDWTKGGVRILSLQFYGDPGNDANDTEKLYVKLNNSRIEYDGDMADIQDASWHEWLIDLGQFGINLSNVTSMSIGFGDETNINPGGTPGGSGVVFFDNIQLRPAGCYPSRVEPPAGDLNGDCKVGYEDLQVITDAWLDDLRQIVQTGLPECQKLCESSDDIFQLPDSGLVIISSDPGHEWMPDPNNMFQAGVFLYDDVDPVPASYSTTFEIDNPVELGLVDFSGRGSVMVDVMLEDEYPLVRATGGIILEADVSGSWVEILNETISLSSYIGETTGNPYIPGGENAFEDYSCYLRWYTSSTVSATKFRVTFAHSSEGGPWGPWISELDGWPVGYVPSGGDASYYPPTMDFNHDCYVDFEDFAVLADGWLEEEELWPEW